MRVTRRPAITNPEPTPQPACRYSPKCNRPVTHYCPECAAGVAGLSPFYCEWHAMRHDEIVRESGGNVFADRLPIEGVAPPGSPAKDARKPGKAALPPGAASGTP
ncbi:MAG: hypothetical protein LAQ30_01670 [Acidobacteriia bacterium]|nr:hypothetical protein [Terriglobia bacterium]